MKVPPSHPSGPPDPSPQNQRSTSPETEPLGGADAVEKTTYVTGQGTDPHTIHRDGVPPVSQSAGSPLLWISIVIALLVAVMYMMGFWA